MTAILVIITVIFFITIDYLVYRKKGTALVQIARDTVENQSTQISKPSIISEEDISLPNGVFLHPKHTWAYVLKSGHVKIGIDSFISKIVSGIDKIVLPPIGTEIKKGQPILNLFSKERSLKLISPIDGKVVSVNEALMSNPELLNDPYNAGWSVIIQPSNLAKDISLMKISEEAIKILKNEFKRFKEFVINYGNGNKLGLQTLQDGGVPVTGILTALDKSKWDLFQKEFLNLEL